MPLIEGALYGHLKGGTSFLDAYIRANINMKTISIVSSQLQLINCVEYLSGINSMDNNLILCATSRERMEQMNKLLSSECYNNFFVKKYRCSLTGFRLLDFFLQYYILFKIRLISLLSSCDIAICGMYMMATHKQLFRYIKVRNPETKFVVVDDGTATLQIVNERKKELSGDIPKMFTGNRFLTSYFRKNISCYITHSLCFYSVYDLDLSLCDTYSFNSYFFIKNNIKNINININSEILDCDILILGQPMYKLGYVSLVTYIKYIKTLSAMYRDKKIVYYSHPFEHICPWDINDKEMSNVFFVKNDISIELLSLLLGERDICIYGFTSSALYNMKETNKGLNVKSIWLDEKDVNDKEVFRTFQICYQEFVKKGIEVLAL